jgi:dTDP-4-dehydrorhamnose reductase
MDRPKILVTGSNGQLGKELKHLGFSFPGFEFVFLSREDLPIHHFETVRNTFEAYQPEFCINCAAYTAVDRAESEPELAFQVNGEAVGVLAAVCHAHHCRLIHISTDYVFDGTAKTPYREDSPVNPRNVYGASKLEGERQAAQYDPDAIIIRTSWVYSEFGKNFIRTMLRLMEEKESVRVVNDQLGSPTYAADLALAILEIIQHLSARPAATGLGGIYHFSNEGAISWYDLAVAIGQLTGSKCTVEPIPTSQFPTPACRPQYSVLDKSKIQRVFGIRIRDWKKSLATCLDRIKKAPN